MDWTFGLGDALRMPFQIDEAMRSLAHGNWPEKFRMTYYRRLAAQVENGITPAAATRQLAARTATRWNAWKYDPDVLAMGEIAGRMENGLPLQEALKGWAKPSELSIIAAGVKSGQVPESLRMVVETGQVVRRIRNRIIAELFEPALMGAMGFYLVYIVGTDMVPAMEGILAPDKWPAMARLLLPMGWFATSGVAPFALGAMVAVIMAILFTMPHWSGGWRRHFDKLPPWSIYRVLQGGAWIVGFTNLIAAGMKMEEALAVQAEMAPRWLKTRLLSARMQVVGGTELGRALQATGYGFPDPWLIQDISTFSGFADFPRLLRKIGDEWMRESEERIVAVLRGLGTMVNVGVNVMILLVVFGMNSLQSIVVSSAHM
uniref:Type II secretion system protein GspF domain-containing protein n=1 Tax=mine drainage metagenome TaxID=410659 RepID=E6QGR3_9ZZZZ